MGNGSPSTTLCSYPIGRRKLLYGQLRAYVAKVFRGLTQHEESRIERGLLIADHVHMTISIPPKSR
ncbi:MAG: transposase [Polaromonas sp.]|nr:transposase [Polaromonas sp.]